MQVTLILLSFIIGVYFIIWGNRVVKRWIRQSLFIYGILFIIAAVSISGMYIIKHTATLKATAKETLSASPAEPAEAKTGQRKKPVKLGSSVQLKAPELGQLPELPRGCEVTALAMLLEYYDIEADKMDLAEEIKTDPTPYHKMGEEIQFGNPHNGFVGDMYSLSSPGLGVYHKPVAELANDYVGDRVLDFTGEDFDEILQQLNLGRPVWVIINTTYKELPRDQFITWQTPDGPVDVTMKEHSVLITGYDEDIIYFNDPLKRIKKAPIKGFKAAWEQMGKQAITIK